MRFKMVKQKDLTIEHLFADTIRVDDCLEWQKIIDKDGYPKRYIDGNINGKVHRKVFWFVNGYYPDVVRHTCDNRKCINPDHLIAGTTLDNVQDRNERCRTYNHRSQEMKDRALFLRAGGASFKEIMKELGLENLRQVEYLLSPKVHGESLKHMNPNRVSQEMKDRAKELKSQGFKYREIMQELGLKKLKQVEWLLK